MSGLAGHTLYAILALRQAEDWTPSLVPLLRRHYVSYLAGAYMGADIQIMPEAVCVETGREVGFGTVPVTESPLTGGAVRPWHLQHDGVQLRPGQIHKLFYGRSHLIFGWSKELGHLRVPWDELTKYAVCVVKDWLASASYTESGLAWIYGWLAHIVSDSMIKSKQPGLNMQLLDGLYTPRNRPIQDLYAFHKMGEELQIDWATLFEAMAQTPVEEVQFHYMRISACGDKLSAAFPDGWAGDQRALLVSVLRENRRWLRHHARDVIAEMQLEESGGRRMPGRLIRQWTGDLNYEEIIVIAERAGMHETLQRIAEETVGLFDHVLAEL